MFARRTNWSLAANRYTVALEEYRRSGRRLLDLTASNPTRAALRYDENAISCALADHRTLDYEPNPKGMLSARQAVAAYYSAMETHPPSRGGLSPQPAKIRLVGDPGLDAENIILTTSTSEAYSFVFRLLCDPGDAVLVPTPSYPLFEFLGGLQDLRLAPYPMLYDEGWHLDLHVLAERVTPRTRAVVCVHPNNPTGSYLKSGEAAALNALCSERNMALVCDEVFFDYGLTAEASSSFAWNSAALTFTLSGISKICGLPQMKLAWMVVSGPETLTGPALARLTVIADTYLSMNAPIQLAAPVLLEQRHSIREQLLSRIRHNLAQLDEALKASSYCRRLIVEGGWYAVLRVPATQSDEEMCVALLQEQGVLVHPGYFYDFAREGCLVLSLITPEAEFAEGLRRMVGFLG